MNRVLRRVSNATHAHTALSSTTPFLSHQPTAMIVSRRFLNGGSDRGAQRSAPPLPLSAADCTLDPAPARTAPTLSPEPVTVAESAVPAEGKTPSAPKKPAYTDWEIRALVMPLIPARSKIPLVELLRHLPLALRAEMDQFPGGPDKFLVAKFPKEIVSPDPQHVARSSFAAAPLRNSASVLPPPPPQGNSASPKVVKSMAPPPPPPPTFVNTKTQSATLGSNVLPSARGFRSPPEVLDALVDYIPTFFVDTRRILDLLPPEITQVFGSLSFVVFLRKYRFYFDLRAAHSQTDVRLRQDVMHPRRGTADFKFAAGIGSVDVMQNTASMTATMKRPPRNSEANLIMFLVPKIPSAFTAVGDVLAEISDTVAKHPSYDPRLGVTGLFEKFPEYFQIVDGMIRIRPFRVAPFALDEKDITTSPFPEILDKVLSHLKGEEWVETGKVFALLDAQEKLIIKDHFKTFPKFLRLHGREVCVSSDNMKVKRFVPENEKCADALSTERLAQDSIKPDDPILSIPVAMGEAVDADWAVKELYDSLPLMQCVIVSDLLDLVSQSIRDALPKDLPGTLAKYPDYFAIWPAPDGPDGAFVVQRAKLVTPEMSDDEIARMVLPLIPQGGIERERLLRKVPLQLQRYLFRHGVANVLGRMNNYFLVVGDKVMRIC
jgi:hypothetical protein